MTEELNHKWAALRDNGEVSMTDKRFEELKRDFADAFNRGVTKCLTDRLNKAEGILERLEAKEELRRHG